MANVKVQEVRGAQDVTVNVGNTLVEVNGLKQDGVVKVTTPEGTEVGITASGPGVVKVSTSSREAW